MNVLGQLLDASKEVSKTLGSGYNEGVYEEALVHEFRLRGIPYERQRNIEIIYKNHCIGGRTPDCVLYPLWSGSKKEFLLEMKCANKITEDHLMQAKVYLNSMNIDRGFLLNFNKKDASVEIEKVSRTKEPARAPCKKPECTKNLQKALTESGRTVLDLLGTEFRYSPRDIYPNAVAVELRLRGFEFGTLEYPILYKNQKVASHTFDYVFKSGEVAEITFYEEEEELAQAAEEMKEYNGLFGIKNGYLLGLPASEKGKVIVKRT